MFRTLLKKQLYEVFKGYFYNAKKNKARSKVSSALWFVFFALIMVGVLGGIFTAVSLKLCNGLVSAGFGWFYFSIMGLLAIMLGVFGSVFNTYAGLYCAGDNDLLFSMPIPVRYILAARLSNVYLMGLMYSAVVFLPSVAVYLITVSFRISVLLGGLIMMLGISVLCLVLSCILGWAVAKISLKLKHKSIATTIVSILFIAAYYFFYFKAQAILQNIVTNAALYGETVKGYAYGIYLWGRTGEGSTAAILTTLLVSALLLVLTWIFMSRSFIKIATSTGVAAHRAYREKAVRMRSISSALFGKELARFTGSANYMLNCGLGILMLIVSGIFFLIKGEFLIEMAAEIMGDQFEVFLILVTAGICVMSSMNDMAAPSISLEGKTLWLLQSLPVTPWQVLCSKLRLQILLSGIPTLFCSICAFIVLPFPLQNKALCLLVIILFTIFNAFVSLTFGLLMPNLSWTSEIAPIKQSLGVMLAILAGFVYTLLFAGIFLLQGWKLGSLPYLTICIGVTVILIAALYLWLKKRGTQLLIRL